MEFFVLVELDVLLVMQIHVALIISDKKRNTFETNNVFDSLTSDVEYTFLKRPSDLIVPPDLIISKLSDVDLEWERVLADEWKHIPHATSTSAQRVVRDRWLTFRKLGECTVDVADTILIQSSEPVPDDLKYPMILKTRIACGPSGSHLVMIATTREDVEKYRSDPVIRSVGDSIIAQQFFPHRKFFKLFCFGDKVFVYEREVMGDMQTGEVFKPAIQSSSVSTNGVGLPETSELISVAQKVQSVFELNLFGIDVIQSGSKLIVVDVNYFPTYKELGGAEFRVLLDQFCRTLVR